MIEFPQASSVPSALREPLVDVLLSLADDDFMLGYWDSEWTGVAPLLEEDVACSSIAQDEIGHARLLYQEVAALTGRTIDQIAYSRSPAEYRTCRLVEWSRGDWAFTMARQYLYEMADQVRLTSLQSSTYLPLAQAVNKLLREETYHQMHSTLWLERLAGSTSEARQRLLRALDQLWPATAGLFEPSSGETLLLQAGILTTASTILQQTWLDSIAPTFTRLQLPLPEYQASNSIGSRYGLRTHDFDVLWERMTLVYRMDPQASW